MKKLLSVFMIIVMCCALIACSSKDESKTGETSKENVGSVSDSGNSENNQQDEGKSNEDYFEWSPMNNTVITGYSELGLQQTNIVIPAKCTNITGLSGNSNVKTITFENPDTAMSGTFSNCPSLEKVVLPSNIKELSMFAFLNCTSLKTITIPDSVIEMGSDVFSGCSALETVVLSKNMKSIPYGTFKRCKSMKSIIMPDSIESIGDYAFEYCDKLETVTFSSNLKTIGDSVFTGCKAIKEVKLPEGVTTIGKNAFWDCQSLQDIYIPSSVTSMSTFSIEQTQNFNVHIVKGSYAEQYIDGLLESNKEFINIIYQ